MSDHDPLCPQELDGFRERCACRIIARVREDERGRAALEIASKTNEHYAYGRADALTQMLEAGNVMGQEFYAKGRADAARDVAALLRSWGRVTDPDAQELLVTAARGGTDD